MASTDTAAPTLSPDLPGDYMVQLIVNHGAVDGSPDQVTITAVTTGEAIQIPIGPVNGMGLLKGVQNSLTAPMRRAADILSGENSKNDGAACGKLNTSSIRLTQKRVTAN